MKKRISAVILCLVLSISALSAAEQMTTTAVFDDLTIRLDKVTRTKERLNIQLRAIFPDETTAKGYEFSVYFRGRGTEPMTLAEINAMYESFRADFSVVLVAFKTLDGDYLLDERVHLYDFATHSEATKQPDGTWVRVMDLNCTNFTSDEEAALLEYTIFDGTPLTGEVLQTLYVELPKAR